MNVYLCLIAETKEIRRRRIFTSLDTDGRLLIYECNSLKLATLSAPNGSCYSCGAEGWETILLVN